MADSRSLDDLLAEALQHPIRGWDFSWPREQGRFTESPLPWDYAHLVAQRARASPDMLDLGTGGGERLAAVVPHPPRTVATESYPPNVRVAARRLAPLGIQVIRSSRAADNDRQGDVDVAGSLPFRDGAFHLIVDRNEAFVAREVARVLAPEGVFLTEQSGSSELPELCELLGLPVPPAPHPSWDMKLARTQVERVGLRVVTSMEARFEAIFSDVGVLVWYLLAVPWAAPGFSPVEHHARLEEIHSRILREGPIRIPRYGFLLEATR